MSILIQFGITYGLEQSILSVECLHDIKVPVDNVFKDSIEIASFIMELEFAHGIWAVKSSPLLSLEW